MEADCWWFWRLESETWASSSTSCRGPASPCAGDHSTHALGEGAQMLSPLYLVWSQHAVAADDGLEPPAPYHPKDPGFLEGSPEEHRAVYHLLSLSLLSLPIISRHSPGYLTAVSAASTFSSSSPASKLLPSPRTSSSGSRVWSVVPAPSTTVFSSHTTSAKDRDTQLGAVKCQQGRQAFQMTRHTELSYFPQTTTPASKGLHMGSTPQAVLFLSLEASSH